MYADYKEHLSQLPTHAGVLLPVCLSLNTTIIDFGKREYAHNLKKIND